MIFSPSTVSAYLSAAIAALAGLKDFWSFSGSHGAFGGTGRFDGGNDEPTGHFSLARPMVGTATWGASDGSSKIFWKMAFRGSGQHHFAPSRTSKSR